MKPDKYQISLLIIVIAFFIWSGIDVQDTRFTWFLEVLPFIIAFPILVLTYKRFPLSNLTYTLIAIHAIILMYGGHYSYAKVPLGFWLEKWFGWTRNNYDKIGHLMQGFDPAICTREILWRTSPLRPGKWLTFMAISVPLAFSALYEIIEWAMSAIYQADAEAFLGTQGYVWDTQTDMFFCLIGSVLALITLQKLHNRSVKRVTASLNIVG
jgi:putative membrane protein